MKKIGLISDPHAYPEPIAEAMAIFTQHEVDAIWCAGDVAGYGERLTESIKILQENNCQSIIGNHEFDYLKKNSDVTDANIKRYINTFPGVIKQQIENISVYMVHASPPDALMDGIRLLDQQGEVIEAEKQSWSSRLKEFEYDVLIVGHTHQVFAETLGSTLVINPGSSQYNHSCAILNLPDLNVEWFALSNQPITKSWNWGMEVAST